LSNRHLLKLLKKNVQLQYIIYTIKRGLCLWY
jgi:hypothetical protein